MKTSKLTRLSTAVAASAVIALSGAPLATSATVQPFGTREVLADPGGMMVAAFTVKGLTPSSDVIPYQPMGRLYEATVTVEAERGSVMPIIPPFQARAVSGQTYPVLAGVATPQGLSPMSLAQGQSNTGKLYFDVTGDTPNSVAYTNGMMDMMLWVGPPVSGAPAPAAPPAPMTPGMMMPGMIMPPPPPAEPIVPMTPGY